MAKRKNMKIVAVSSGKAPDLRPAARAFARLYEKFFQDPEMEREYQEWLKEQDERGKVIDEKMMRYEPGSKMREILKRTREHRAMPRGKGKPGMVFSYKLENAWGHVLHSVVVLDDKLPYVCYSFDVKNEGREGDILGEGGDIGIERAVLVRIRSLLEDDRLFETEWLEEPYDMAFLDGVTQVFRINNGGRSICAEGDNLNYCRDDEEHCPHTVLMVRILEKVKEILEPLGVPEVCFRLDE